MFIEEEFVSFVEPVSVDGSLHQVLRDLEHAMHKAVKRDVNARCDKWSETAAEYTGAAQAVLVSDKVHYTKIIE